MFGRESFTVIWFDKIVGFLLNIAKVQNLGCTAFLVQYIPCHHGSSRPQVAVGEDGLWICSYIYNEYAVTDSRQWMALEAGNNPSP